jgi:hypothetical protein
VEIEIHEYTTGMGTIFEDILFINLETDMDVGET